MASIARGIEKEAPAEQLRRLDDEKQRAEKVLREVESKRSAVLAVLERVEREIRAAESDARAAHVQEAKATALLETAREREESVRLRRVALARELSGRLLLRYRLRGTSYLRMILSARSIGDVLWRRRMVDRVLASDFAALRRWGAVQDEAGRARDAVWHRRQDLADAEQAARDREADAAARRAVQDAVLRGLLRQKSTWSRILAEVEASRASLLKLMATLPPTPPGLGGFSRMRGQLPWPARGTVEVKFGRQVDPRFRTVVQQKGYDLRCAAGTPVAAPYRAIVAYAGWFSGFGNLVILDHGEGYYSLYAHMREIAVSKGDRLEAGSALGAVGDTGSLKGPYLYFELRSGSKALDPGRWLRKR